MIKWAGFGKLLKQSFFILLISCFILLGSFYVSASNFQLFPVSLDKSQSYWNNQYEVGFLPKGRFLSMYLGTSKSLLALDNSYLMWWGSNGGLYMYYNSPSNKLNLIQGFFQYIKVCDEISIHFTGSDIIRNCGSSQQVGVSNDIITDFINKIKLGDYVYIDDNLQFNLGCGGNCTYDSYNIEICFSSDEVGKSMCFLGEKNSGPYGTSTPLTQSQSMSGVNFANIPQSYLSDPPGFTPGTNIDGGSTVVGNSDLNNGSVMYSTCTNGYVMSQLDVYFAGRRYACQGGLLDTGIILDSVSMATLNPIPGQGVDFKTVYNLTSNGMSWNDWFNTYSSTFKNWYYNQNVYSTNPFYGKNALLFSYFKILNDIGYLDNSWRYDILNACKLLLYSDWNAEYKGKYFAGECSNLNTNSGGGGIYSTGEVGSVDSDDEVLPPGYDDGGDDGKNGGSDSTSSGTIIGSDWSGVKSGSVQKKYNGSTFINDYFQELKSTYLKPSIGGGSSGYLPSYIMVFLCGILLFRFLRH